MFLLCAKKKTKKTQTDSCIFYSRKAVRTLCEWQLQELVMKLCEWQILEAVMKLFSNGMGDYLITANNLNNLWFKLAKWNEVNLVSGGDPTHQFTQPLQTGCDTRSIFKQSRAGLNSGFSWLTNED